MHILALILIILARIQISQWPKNKLILTIIIVLISSLIYYKVGITDILFLGLVVIILILSRISFNTVYNYYNIKEKTE